MLRAGSAVTVGERLGEGGQGVVHAVTIGGAPYAVKWYRYAPSGELRKSIAALVERGRPHRDFIWPIDLVVSDELSGFGYVMPRLEPRFSSFAQLVSRSDQPPFRVVSTIGRHLVTAFEALHSAGLCYRDISFGNLWVDADASEVAIIDNDNVGLDGGEVFVWGTLRFMAPEVVRREAAPSSLTDLHSLAVFLFYLFMHGHPLEGVKTDESYSWADSSHRSETDLALRHFGTEPVFIFDPDDHSNPPRPGDPGERLVAAVSAVLPRRLRARVQLGPARPVRPRAASPRASGGARWSGSPTACRSAPVRPRSSTTPTTPGCAAGTAIRYRPKPMLVELPGGTIVLSQGAMITSHHLTRNRDHDTVIAVGGEPPRAPWRARAPQREHEGLDDDSPSGRAPRPSTRSAGLASAR